MEKIPVAEYLPTSQNQLCQFQTLIRALCGTHQTPRRFACSSRLYHWVVIMTNPGETEDCRRGSQQADHSREEGTYHTEHRERNTDLKNPEEDALDHEALERTDNDRQDRDDAPEEAVGYIAINPGTTRA